MTQALAGGSRYTAAALGGVAAALYVLIATSTVGVIDPAPQVADARHDQLVFATPAAIVYALGAVLLLIPALDRRSLWPSARYCSSERS